MDLGFAILRLIHIVSGVLWVGMGFTLFVFVIPVAKQKGHQSADFIGGMFSRTLVARAFPIASTLTIGAGILIYLMLNPFNADWMRDFGNQILSLGAVFGILAFGHGATAMERATKALAESSQAIASTDSPTDEQVQDFIAKRDKYARNGRISLILSVIALIAMAIFRYL